MTTALKKMTSGITAGPTVGAGYAKGLVDFAASIGAERAKLLSLAQISAGEIADLDNRIPVARYVALMRAAADVTGEAAFSLRYGEAVRMQEISIVGLICEACETTPDVGVQLNRYWRLVLDGDAGAAEGVVRLTRREDGLWFELTSEICNTNPLIAEAEFARLVWNTRTMFAGNAEFQAMMFPEALQFRHKAPSYRTDFDRVFGAPVTFEAGWNAMRIDKAFLSLRQPPVNRYVFGVLSSRAEALLESLERATSVRAKVESLLIPELHKGEPSVEAIAKAMGLSRPTLYRKLKAEGVTFEKLLDELRHKMAAHYLDGKKVSVNETAYLVGFSEPSAFSRAFKRWTGTSPRKRAI